MAELWAEFLAEVAAEVFGGGFWRRFLAEVFGGGFWRKVFGGGFWRRFLAERNKGIGDRWQGCELRCW